MDSGQGIKAKLVFTSFAIIVLAFLLMGGVGVLNVKGLVSKILGIGEQQSKSAVIQIENSSRGHIEKIQRVYKDAVEQKGGELLDRHRLVIEPFFRDNAYSDLNDFLQRFFDLDSEIVFANFFIVEEGVVKSWKIISHEHPKGLGLGAVYNQSMGSWVSKSALGKALVLGDDSVARVINSKKKRMVYRKFSYRKSDDIRRTIPVLDCSISIHLSDEPEQDDANVIGYLQYCISLEKVEALVETEQRLLSSSLEKLDADAQHATKEARELEGRLLSKSLIALVGSALVILLLLYFPTDFFVSKLMGRLVESNKALVKAKDQAESVTREREEYLRISTLTGELRERLIPTQQIEDKLSLVVDCLQDCFAFSFAGIYLRDVNTETWRLLVGHGVRATGDNLVALQMVEKMNAEHLIRGFPDSAYCIDKQEAISQGLDHAGLYPLMIGGVLHGLILVLKNREVVNTYEDVVLEGLQNTAAQLLELMLAQEQLREAQSQVVDAAHEAGMAEVATGVLHNVGNILNGVNIAGESISGLLRKSKQTYLEQANQLLSSHRDDMNDFLLNDEKGKALPELYLYVGEALKEEHETLMGYAEKLVKGVSMVKDVIATQQSYAKSGLFMENENLSVIAEDALSLQLESLKKYGVEVEKSYDVIPRVMVQKSKLAHILVNLFKNAQEAMDTCETDKKILVEIGEDQLEYFIKVSDTGEGIADEVRGRIFTHGFTTKKTGHGFGLHASANAMTEMGGSLSVSSKGENCGATFVLHFPKSRKDEDV